MLRVKSKQRIGLSLLTLLVMLFMTVSVAHAANSYLTEWSGIYTSSTSDNAGCQLCHASSFQNLNPYGRAICQRSESDINARIQAAAVQNANSDLDPTGSSNIIEINENTQPGWTTTAVPIYDRDNCSISIGTETSPTNVSGLDPTTNILVWEPLTMDIGEVPIGGTGYGTLTLTNSDLNNPITINSIVFDFNQQGTFGLQTSEPIPAVLPPQVSMQVVISFTPVDISFAMADIRITNTSTNAPSLLYSVMGLGLSTTTTTQPTTSTTTLPPTTTTTLAPTTTTTTLPTSTTTTTLPSEDLCPDNPNKTEPGVCGCGISDVDSDEDGIEDCIVVNLQSIISRQIDPIHPSVITIGYLKSGTVDNVIAEKAMLKGTIRSTNEFIRAEIIEKIKKLASSMAILYGAEITVEMKPGYPPIVNEEIVSKFAVQVSEKLLGKDKTIAIPYPSLGGEDFSYYLQQIPGCFVRYGAAKEGHETASSHSPNFDFDEEALRVGAAYMSELIRLSIKKLRKK